MTKATMQEESQTPQTTSEFGKGLVYNLILFAAHFERRLNDILDLGSLIKGRRVTNERLMRKMEIYNTPQEALSSEITLWANGASDHLYEIQIPDKWKETEIGNKILELQDKGLKMGHGFRNNKTYNSKDFFELQRLTKDIGMLIDKELGVESIRAEYE